MRRTAAATGSAVFFAVAPGGVTGVVPWWLTGWRAGTAAPLWSPVRALGAALAVAGGVVLVHAFTRFVFEGSGTPAPIAPTERLVVGGLYRYVRNPMYLALVAVIVGQALFLGRPVLIAYAAVIWAAVATFVWAYEEPTLEARFGAEYDAYRRAVPAWHPRRRPWSPPSPPEPGDGSDRRGGRHLGGDPR